ncbi:hypothetical protein PIB30_090370 [Stylosanthes scabra]|uniref:Uncharacterized protein n=1 Tax=Stylosanthes scabra TaxID=79078 RepID=A0ABU6TUZ1_9FABA|nr:hypothetical protein [Stylosanthes scabra]
MLPELRQGMSLTEGGASEGDYVIEAAGPSDWLPFWAEEDKTHFLRPFSLDDEGKPFPWVYWNLEKSNFKCRWIIDHSDGEVGTFLDSLLGDMEKQSWFDRLRLKIVEAEGVGPRSILSTPNVPVTSAGASASSPVTVVLPGPSSGAARPKKQKRRKWKLHESFPEDEILGDDAAWEHKVNPLDRAFPEGFNFRATLDFGITQDEVVVLTVERDTALTSPPLQAKIDSLTEQLSVAQGEHLSALEQLSQEEWRKVEALTHSLEEKQMALGMTEAATDHWSREWKDLAVETEEIVQETFEILMDQVRHLNPTMDFSVITLDTRWDPKGQRIYNPKEEAEECSKPVVEV